MLVTVQLAHPGLIKDAADRLLISEQDYVQRLVDRECLRLWHIERSKPKAPPPERDRELEHLTADLRLIYSRLKSLYSSDYERLYGLQERIWQEMVERRQVDDLREFWNRQPWQHRAGLLPTPMPEPIID